MTDIIRYGEKLKTDNSPWLQAMSSDMNTRGADILELLRKLEILLESKQ